MLGGRCSYASSLFPIPPSKLENPLSPFFPLHTQIPPVSPLLPLDTKMRGRGASLLHNLSSENFQPFLTFFTLTPAFASVFYLPRGRGSYFPVTSAVTPIKASPEISPPTPSLSLLRETEAGNIYIRNGYISHLVGTPTFSANRPRFLRPQHISSPDPSPSPPVTGHSHALPAFFYNSFIFLSHSRHHPCSFPCHNTSDF
jgi:hypothetical protein